MSGVKPFFLTGTKAVIKVDDVVVAYAVNVSGQVSVKHVSPRVLGRAEVEVHQPVQYDVSGQLSVIKYGKNFQSAFKDAAPIGGNDDGSGANGYKGKSFWASSFSFFSKINSSGPTGNAEESFNPSRMFQSQQFDIEIFQKTHIDSEHLVPIFKFRDCRFTNLSFSMEKKSPVIVQMSFVARYYDDDTLVARRSGVGQEFS